MKRLIPKTFYLFFKLVVSGIPVLSLLFVPLVAQSQETASSGKTLEEVIVTAQRREQSLMEVPIAVAVVTGDTMEEFNLEGSHDLQFFNPGIQFTNVSGTSQVTLRGVGTGYSGPGLSNSVATYIDESYVTAQVGGAQFFIDMENVQILKGPQGTLYGRNATGGAVLYKTKDPDLEAMSGSVQVGFGELSTTEFEGIINWPISDSVAVRAALKVEDRDEGYVTNVRTGEELGKHENVVGRLKVLWQPSDRLKAVYKYEETSSDRKDSEFRLQRATGLMCAFCVHPVTGEIAADGNGLGFYETNQTTNEEAQADIEAHFGGDNWIAGNYLRGRQDVIVNALNVDFDVTDNLTFSSITMMRDMQRFGGQDQDASPFNAIDAWGAKRYPEDDKGGITFESFTQEVKLASDYDGPFNFVTGWSHSDDDNAFVLGLGGVYYLPFELIALSTNDNESNSYYFDGAMDVTDRLTITAGVRTTDDELDMSIVYPLLGPASLSSDSVDYSETTYRFVVDYDLSDSSMIYASFNTGIKSGGFNSPGYAIAPPLPPEEIDAIEFGGKFSWGSTSIEFAYFDYEWENLQVAIISTTAGGLSQESAAAAESQGFEFSANFEPSENLSVGIGGLWLEGEYVDYNSSRFYPASWVTPGARGFLGSYPEDLSGYQTANSPELSLRGNLSYRFNAGQGIDGTFSALVSYSDEYDMIAGAGGAARLDRQDSLMMVNLKLNLAHSNGWSAELYVNNATDEEWVYELQTQTDGTYASPSLPRVAGARLRYEF